MVVEGAVERARPIMPYWLALLTAAAGGVALDTGFPDKDVWPVTFLGIGLVLVSLIGRRFWGALLIGLVGGFSFWGVHIFWLTLYLGPIPWLALGFCSRSSSPSVRR